MLLCTKNRILLLDDKIRQWTMEQDRIQFKQWKGRYYHRMKHGSGWTFPTQYREMIETYYQMNCTKSVTEQDVEKPEEEEELDNLVPEENITTSVIEEESLLSLIETSPSLSVSASDVTKKKPIISPPIQLTYKYDIPMEMKMHFQKMYEFPSFFSQSSIR